ncbi:M48 family metallopeptidase [Saccharospirillum impatiens]|uniref:M48 family metallopeptidase n=1 Tax=Saccharospirillum impatiens TaxID=169438 RepID=UPI0003F5F0DD|nr:YgjP-like metallopeptidase domain-containing protein [Saccharospirillum impatiens]
MTESLTWSGGTIPVTRSKRKTVALHVRDGAPELRAPWHLNETDLKRFLKDRETWLTKALDSQAEKQSQKPDFSQQEHCPLMDEHLTLTLQLSARSHWHRVQNRLILGAPVLDKPHVHHVLADFYKTQAQYTLFNKTRDRVKTEGWEHRLTDVRLRRTKTKWGHCTATGRIQYNWLIMLAPERIVDYLVAHETAHLLHPHHRSPFWAEVERLHPSWQADRLWLHEHGHRLWL